MTIGGECYLGLLQTKRLDQRTALCVDGGVETSPAGRLLAKRYVASSGAERQGSREAGRVRTWRAWKESVEVGRGSWKTTRASVRFVGIPAVTEDEQSCAYCAGRRDEKCWTRSGIEVGETVRRKGSLLVVRRSCCRSCGRYCRSCYGCCCGCDIYIWLLKRVCVVFFLVLGFYVEFLCRVTTKPCQQQQQQLSS